MAKKDPDLVKKLKLSMRKLPWSRQRKILGSVLEMLEQGEPENAQQIEKYLHKISKGPRLVTHIDADGVVSAIMMCAANHKKYKEILYSDYSILNKGNFMFLETDDVVDLPQPRNPVLDADGNPMKKDLEIIFKDLNVNFWADHHETGKRGAYKGRHLFDPNSPSCASLLYRHFLPEIPGMERFKELVDGTDIVDAAMYATPEAPYDLKNPAVVLRLMLISKAQRKTKHDFRAELIQQAADPENNWKDIIYQPLVKAMADESLAEFEKYRAYIKPFIKSQNRVTIRIQRENRPKGTGLKDRYYPNTLFPDNLFLIDAWKNFIGNEYSVGISENIMAKDKKGNHPSQLSLGEELHDIVKRTTGLTVAGGHKSIGMCSTVPPDKVDDVVEACKDLLFSETKRLGY